MFHLVEHEFGGRFKHLVDDFPVDQEHGTIGVRGGNRVVGDHDDGLLQIINGAAHEIENFGAGGGIQISGGLIGKDDFRVGRQRPRHCNTLLLTAGEFAGAMTGAVAQPDAVEHIVEPCLIRITARQIHRQSDVFDRGEGRHEIERLEHEADLVAAKQCEVAFGKCREVGVADADLSAGERVEAGQAVHERRLAGSGRAHDGGELALAKVDGHAVECAHLGVALAVDLGCRYRSGRDVCVDVAGCLSDCHLATFSLGSSCAINAMAICRSLRRDHAYDDAVNCPSCGAAVASDARFCHSCGHELAARGDERRVVTVLFADIVGFTGFSETRDPEQVKNLVDRCFALLADDISAFGGRVDKIVGDAIIALFGAPIAHEDDAERAVRAALRMQETVEAYDADTGVGIRLRIGINTGEVLVGAITAGDEYTAMGDVVNTAARLETIAKPGTVIVGEDTHTATAEVIHYQSLGMLHARGRDSAVEAWRAVEPVGRPGERRGGRDTPLLGREPELAILRRAVSAGIRRNRAQLLTLTGESGVGKTRLAAEVASLARFDHGALVLAGRCLPYGDSNAWGPIAEAIRGFVGIDSTATDHEARSIVGSSVAAALGSSAAQRDIDRTIEGLLHLMGLSPQLANLAQDHASSEGRRSLRVLIEALAEDSPVMLWLGDIHWADKAVLRLLDGLLDRLSRTHFVLLVTARTAALDHWSPAPGQFNQLALSIEPLDDTAASLLTRDLLPGVSEDVRKQVVERSAGNPLFIEEMARTLSVSDGTEVLSLPSNVRSAISARLDELPDGARGLLEDAAVLGLRGEVVALRRTVEAERTKIDVDAALRDLARADLIETTSDVWVFRSSLVREVAYGRLTKSDRARRHAGIAWWVESNNSLAVHTIAYHYRQSAVLVGEIGLGDGLPSDITDRAIDWTIRAARDSASSSAVERADRLYGAALDLMDPEDSRRVTALLERASAAVLVVRLDAVAADLAEARPLIDQINDPELLARVALIESEAAQWADKQEVALERADEALRLGREVDDPILVAHGLRRRGVVQLFMGRNDESEVSITDAYRCYERAGDPAGMAWARQNLAWLSFIAGHMTEAEERLAASIEAFDALGDVVGRSWSTGLLAYVRIHDGRFEEADELARRTLDDACDRGDMWGASMMNVALATSALWTGRVEEAIDRAREALKTFPVNSDPVGYSQATAVLGRALVQAGRVEEGFATLRKALTESEEGDNKSEILKVAMSAGAAAVGDTVEAAKHFGEIVRIDPDTIGESDRAVAAALSRLQMGQPAEAMKLLDLMLAIGADQGSTWGWAVVALASSALGLDSAKYTEIVESSPRSTYSDRVLARCASACAAARSGDASGVRVAIKQAIDAVPDGGDRANKVMVAIAESECLRAVSAAEADDVFQRSRELAGSTGIDDTGWRTAFAVACGQEVVPISIS